MSDGLAHSPEKPNALAPFTTLHRAKLSVGQNGLRTVYRSCLADAEESKLAAFVSEKAPEFYRPLPSIIEDLKSGFPLTTFKDTLARLPLAESFRSSHFGEILACLFAEEVMGFRRIYSKLSLLTSENSNAFKMDLLMYDALSEPLELILGEVKSSPKHAAEGMPPRHDSSCYADIFNSLRKYEQVDLEFDLAAARDRLDSLPAEDQDRVKTALLPYSQTAVRFAAFAMIDESTFDPDEATILWRRKSTKEFEVELVGVCGYAPLADEVYTRLAIVLDALRKACS